MRLRRAEDGTLIQTLAGHKTAVAGVAWSPDGRLLASAGGGGAVGELLVWDAESGELLRAFPGIASVVFKITWSKDSKVLLSGGSGGVIRWWDAASGAEIAHHQSHLGWVRSLSVSPDGSLQLSSGRMASFTYGSLSAPPASARCALIDPMSGWTFAS